MKLNGVLTEAGLRAAGFATEILPLSQGRVTLHFLHPETLMLGRASGREGEAEFEPEYQEKLWRIG